MGVTVAKKKKQHYWCPRGPLCRNAVFTFTWHIFNAKMAFCDFAQTKDHFCTLRGPTHLWKNFLSYFVSTLPAAILLYPTLTCAKEPLTCALQSYQCGCVKSSIFCSSVLITAMVPR